MTIDPNKVLNDSGFLLQYAVEHSLRTGKAPLDECTQELPWHHVQTGEAGHLDLFFRVGWVHYVCECKRADPVAPWVFPVFGESRDSRFFQVANPRHNMVGWIPMHGPEAHRAEICAMPGEGGRRDRRDRLVERTASRLVLATEALAQRDAEVTGVEFSRLFVPLLVTTTPLMVRRVQRAQTSLETGRLPDGPTEEVAAVVFHKPLSIPTQGQPKGMERDRLVAELGRSVLIVRASRLAECVARWSFHTDAGMYRADVRMP